MKTIEQLLSSSKRTAKEVSLQSPIQKITDDSRGVLEGTLFFAIKGTKVDGHRYVASLPSGAIAVVEDKKVFDATRQCVWVENTRRAFALASAAWFGEPSSHFQLVGVTGTNGKTTSAFLLRQVWESFGKVTGMLGTVEHVIGEKRIPSALTTPGPFQFQSLLSEMRAEGVEFAVSEVSSIGLDQERVTGTHFEVALFTNLSQDHLDYHRSLEAYFESKRMLFVDLLPKKVAINLDDPFGKRLFEDSNVSAQKLGFSIEGDGEIVASQVSLAREGSTATIKTPDGSFKLETKLLGRHNIYNCLGVLSTCHLLGFSTQAVLESLAKVSAPAGRLEQVTLPDLSVFVDYAHTPDALENVLNLLREVLPKTGRLICVFGCGGDRDRAKRPQMAQVVSSLADVIVVTSDNPRTEDPEKILDDIEVGFEENAANVFRQVDRRLAIYKALSQAKPSDIVLVAGKGHETYQIVGEEKLDFDDRQVVRDYVAQS